MALCAADVSQLKDANGYAYPTPSEPFTLPPPTYLPPVEPVTKPPPTYLPPVEEVTLIKKNLFVN